MTEQQFDTLVEHKLSQILKAAADYNTNPDKAKEYITRTIRNISEASKQLGQMSLVDELFG
jgi:phage portal protein BeeE